VLAEGFHTVLVYCIGIFYHSESTTAYNNSPVILTISQQLLSLCISNEGTPWGVTRGGQEERGRFGIIRNCYKKSYKKAALHH
jgi:hypothetical protein